MTDITGGDQMADPADAQPYEMAPEESEQLDQDPMQPGYSLNDRGVADALDEGYSPPEKYSAAQGFGNTAEEQAEGETLDMRVAQEEPEVWETVDLDAENLNDGEVGDERAGRLMAPDQGLGEDVDSELVGLDAGIDAGAASAEEAAVHIVPDDRT
ncbi:MAG: DUF5709 domain-containing protein [Actinomycetes bacterium]